MHKQAQVSSFETFYSKPESLTYVLLSKYIEYQPSYPWYSPNCCWKMLLLSDLVTAKAASEPLLSKVARCIPVLPSRYTGKCAAPYSKALWLQFMTNFKFLFFDTPSPSKKTCHNFRAPKISEKRTSFLKTTMFVVHLCQI